MLNIAFRADSSHIIGTGHIMRCLTLAHTILKQYPANIYFFTRKANGNINGLIVNSGFKILEMQPPVSVKYSRLEHSAWLGATQTQDAEEFLQLSEALAIGCFDYLIIDHYAIDQFWQKKISSSTKKIVVIDDLGDRFQHCDYLLDQTYNCPIDKYAELVPAQCQLMLGTNFALLRDEFQLATDMRPANKKNNILVMFGGTDPDNLTQQALQELCIRNDLHKISVIIGSSAQHIDALINYINQQKNNSSPYFELYINPSNIAQLMRRATLAIGAAGTTSWERCATGLPSVVVIQAENQKHIAFELDKLKVLTFLEAKQIKTLLNKQITAWLNDPIRYQNAIEQGNKICDGYGASRVVKRIFADEK